MCIPNDIYVQVTYSHQSIYFLSIHLLYLSISRILIWINIDQAKRTLFLEILNYAYDGNHINVTHIILCNVSEITHLHPLELLPNVSNSIVSHNVTDCAGGGRGVLQGSRSEHRRLNSGHQKRHDTLFFTCFVLFCLVLSRIALLFYSFFFTSFSYFLLFSPLFFSYFSFLTFFNSTLRFSSLQFFLHAVNLFVFERKSILSLLHFCSLLLRSQLITSIFSYLISFHLI